MRIGVNFGGNTYYGPDPVFIDRMRLGTEVLAKTGNASLPVGPYDPVTLLPTGPGAVPRIVPLDPGPHDYVILFDQNVSRISVNGATKPPVIVGNRATFSANLPTDGLGVQVTQVATGPVKKFQLMRADHEPSLVAGEIFNPDFAGKAAPFRLYRPLDWNCANADIFPAQRPLSTDAYVQDTRGGMPAELTAAFARKMGAALWYPLNPHMTDAQMLEVMRALAGLRVCFEWANEFGWTYHKAWAFAQAATHYGIASPTVFDMLRYYGFRAGKMGLLAASVDPAFRVNLSAQSGPVPDKALAAILAGWDEAKAPRWLIDGFANEGYLGWNYPASQFTKLLVLQAANDVEGFYAAHEVMLADKAALYRAAAKASQAQGIPFKIYETNISIFTSAPALTDPTRRAALITWVKPLVHSDRMADILMRNVQAAGDAGAAEVLMYQMTGAGSQYGFWGLAPHVSQPGFPIYDRITKAAQPDYQALAAKVAAMQRDLAALAGEIHMAVAG